MNAFKAKTFLDSAGVAFCGKNHAQRKIVRSGHTDCPACAKHSRQFRHFSSSTTLTGCAARVASAASCPYPRRSAKRSSRACGGGDHIAPAAAYFYAPKPRSAAFAGRVALGPSFGIRSSGLASNCSDVAWSRRGRRAECAEEPSFYEDYSPKKPGPRLAGRCQAAIGVGVGVFLASLLSVPKLRKRFFEHGRQVSLWLGIPQLPCSHWAQDSHFNTPSLRTSQNQPAAPLKLVDSPWT